MNRLFLALPVTLFDYTNLQNDFEGIIQGRWVPQQNLHLTLKFFGNSFEEEFLIEKLSALDLQAETSELKGLELLNNNKILYAKTQNPSLQRLYAEIQESFALPSQQEFTPHITLMRIKKIQDKPLLERRLQEYQEKSLGRLYPNIQLIQSRLSDKAAKYECVKEFKA